MMAYSITREQLEQLRRNAANLTMGTNVNQAVLDDMAALTRDPSLTGQRFVVDFKRIAEIFKAYRGDRINQWTKPTADFVASYDRVIADPEILLREPHAFNAVVVTRDATSPFATAPAAEKGFPVSVPPTVKQGPTVEERLVRWEKWLPWVGLGIAVLSLRRRR